MAVTAVRRAVMRVTASPVPPVPDDSDAVGDAPGLISLLQALAHRRGWSQPWTVAIGAVIVLASGAAVVIGASVGLLLAGIAGRLVLRHVGVAQAHPIIAIAVAWVVIAAEVVAAAWTFRAWRRRHPAVAPAPASTAAASPAAESWRRRIAGDGLEAVTYAVVALLLIWPVSLHLTSAIPGGGDVWGALEQGWSGGQQIRAGHVLPLTLPDLVWPYGVNLLNSDGYIPFYVSSLWNLLASPILAINLSMITASILNMWSGRHLARTVSDRRLVWMVCAIAFATAPAVAMRFKGHYNLVFMFGIALVIAEALRTVRHRRPIRPVRVALLLYITYLCSIYDLVFAAMAFAIIVLGSQPGWRAALRQSGRCAMALAGCAVLMLPFVIAHERLDAAELAHGAKPVASSEAYLYSADLIAVATPPVHEETIPLPRVGDLYRRVPDNGLEATTFPGYAVLLAFCLLLWLRSRVRTPLLVAAGAIWLFSLGTSLRVAGLGVMVPVVGQAQAWLPYQALLYLPGFSALRTPDRASFALAVVGIAMLAIGLHWLLREGRRGRAALIAVGAAGLLATNLVIPVPSATMDAPSDLQAAFARIAATAPPSSTLLYAPADCSEPAAEAGRFETLHQHPVIGCQSNWASIPWYSNLDLYARSPGLAALRCDPTIIGRRTSTAFSAPVDLTPVLVDELRHDLGVRYVLVDKIVAGKDGCAHMAAQIPVLRGYHVLEEDDRYLLVDVG